MPATEPHFIPGAEPVALDAGSRGVLILHGFGDTPQSVRNLATRLHERDWTVRAPALRGHGTSLKAFTQARADAWLGDTRETLRELRTRCEHIGVIGQSMGGAIATILAGESPVDGLVLLAPFMQLTPRASIIGACHRVVTIVKPYWRSRSEGSIRDPMARRNALGRGIATPRLMHELALVVREAKRAAERVQAPTLVIHSRSDPRITVRDAKAAFARLGTKVKELEWAERSGHVLSVDYDRDWVASRAIAWLESHVASGQAGQSAKRND